MTMLYPYKSSSNSAKLLAQALNIKRIKHEGSSLKGHEDKIVINWGATDLPEEVMKCSVINHPSAVKVACDKLMFYEAVKDKVNIPPFTTDREKAEEWLSKGSVVLGRNKLNGHSGEGIFIYEKTLEPKNVTEVKILNSIKVWVKYIPKKEEYRVHVVDGTVIDVRQKVLQSKFKGMEGINWKVRNHKNGFIYQKNDIEVPEGVIDQALKAIDACHLTFGAVDVIWNNFYNKAYVLEINTAPGLEGSSVDNYAEAFAAFLEDEKVKEKTKKTVKDINAEMEQYLAKVHAKLAEQKAPEPLQWVGGGGGLAQAAQWVVYNEATPIQEEHYFYEDEDEEEGL